MIDSGLKIAGHIISALRLSGPEAAEATIKSKTAGATEDTCLACAEVLMKSNFQLEAAAVLNHALKAFPASLLIRLRLAEQLRFLGDLERAEQVLRSLLAIQPTHEKAVWSLGEILIARGKYDAAAYAVLEIIRREACDLASVLRGVEFLRRCQRDDLAIGVCEQYIVLGMEDRRLQQIAGQLELARGNFVKARNYLLAAFGRGRGRGNQILHALSLSRKYEDLTDSDFTLFENALASSPRPTRERASVLFALGKAYDDIGNCERAAKVLTEGNDILRKEFSWSSGEWNAIVEKTIKQRMPRFSLQAHAQVTPVFIVGLPRSGTTLIAEQLTKHPQVLNRGETGWISYVDSIISEPRNYENIVAWDAAARLFYTHMIRDGNVVPFVVDKNPLNFRHLGLISRLFPNARVIYCRRGLRDTALSLWFQFFANPDVAFSYDFFHIAEYARSVRRLMSHWKSQLPLPTCDIDYESMVETPQSVTAKIFDFLGVSGADDLGDNQTRRSIQTASLWQVRQPINRASIGRWRRYATHLLDMRKAIPDEEERC